MAAELLNIEMSEQIQEVVLLEDSNTELKKTKIEETPLRFNTNNLDITIQEGEREKSLIDIPTEDIKNVLARCARTPNDTNDPSYTQLTVPYRVTCRQRYQKAQKKQINQFITEIKAHELLRDKALDGVRIHREFCRPVICSLDARERIKLTERQKVKINRLMKDN